MSEKKKDPIPQGKYVPAARGGNLVFTAGMTPRKDGALCYAMRGENRYHSIFGAEKVCGTPCSGGCPAGRSCFRLFHLRVLPARYRAPGPSSGLPRRFIPYYTFANHGA